MAWRIIPAYAGNTTHASISPIIESGSSPHTRGTPSFILALTSLAWDHPRIRGEHAPRDVAHLESGGIIPAYAGNTTGTLALPSGLTGSSPHTRGTRAGCISDAPIARDHPRIRGEHVLAVQQRQALGGSSPHTRGTHRVVGYVRVISRDHPRIRGEHGQEASNADSARGIIPAYAGNTVQALRRCLCCGGSSPHTRGTLDIVQDGVVKLRDHPRIRGEHARTRVDDAAQHGIIPAYAGNTVAMVDPDGTVRGSSPHTRGTPVVSGNASCARGDHPRIRGEHETMHRAHVIDPGIIPAYAGNTLHHWEVVSASPGSSPHTRGTQALPDGQLALRRDHPRIRGEHQRREIVLCARKGIIPAYAGNTLIYLRSQFPAWQFCITSSKATGLVPLACIAPA